MTPALTPPQEHEAIAAELRVSLAAERKDADTTIRRLEEVITLQQSHHQLPPAPASNSGLWYRTPSRHQQELRARRGSMQPVPSMDGTSALQDVVCPAP